MPSPQKNKGSSWERTVAVDLSTRFNESFIRAPGSGAYVGGSNSSRKQVLHEGQVRSFKGDIVPGQSFPRLNAECKSYKDFPFHQLFSNSCSVLESWIDQCMDVADPDDFNIIFMKFNRKGTFIAFQLTNSENLLTTANQLLYTSKRYGSWVFIEYQEFFKNYEKLFKERSNF